MPDKCNIMIAVDGSRFADDALKWYSQHAHIKTNSVILVYICDSFPVYSSPLLRTALLVSQDEVTKFQEEREKTIKQIVEKYTQLCRDEIRLPMRIMVREGVTPGHVIVELAETEGCSLVVVGSRGHGTTRRTILGSTSTYILHHAAMPVAVHKP